MNKNLTMIDHAVPPARLRAVVAIVLIAAVMSACTGRNAKPGDSLADAETAVARAERARVGDYDAASWKAARENLAKARAASAGKDNELTSRWYASRARADADLGIARAERARLAALTLSLKREIEILQAPPSAGVAP